MRKLTAILLCTAALLNAAPRREGLGRSFTKLRKTGQLTVGYFGGSITAGGGASKAAETSYRALTTRWFRAQFPKAEITEINAAIGGTGSDLGAFRCQNDLLAKHPDLVFVEFAVNDNGSNQPRVLRSMEGIVRQIWRANPATDIVFLYTINKTSMAEIYERGEKPKTVIWDERVAETYGIPSLNIGMTFWEQAHAGKAAWEKLLPDNVHPSDLGHVIYTQQITAYLEAHRQDKPGKPHRKLPKPIADNPLELGRMADASEITAPGWLKDDPAAQRFPHSISAEKPGTELRHRFSGTAIGIYWLIAPDSGDIEWSIDGGAPQRASSWDKYALRYSRVNYRILNDDLSPGQHELTLRILPEKNTESKGTWLRIGALLINGEPPSRFTNASPETSR